MLASLPSIYMQGPDIVYIINSLGVKAIKIKDLDNYSITNDYWSLIDSNKQLETVPVAIYSLHTFIIQSASPRDKRTEWYPSSPPIFHERMGSFRAHHCVRFFTVVCVRLLIHIYSAELHRRGLPLPDLILKLS